MKLKEYTERLNQLSKNHPEASNYEVVTSRDDEGNGFNRVHYHPSIGNFSDGEFSEESKPNSVCLN